MHCNSWLRVLLLFGLCSALLAAAALPVSSDPDCPYEPLPESLDTLSGLGFNGELNIHNQYYTPFVRGQNHAITFTLTQPSAFRIYIEPHYVDIDIWLYKDSTSIAHTSDYSLADEVVFKTLDPGNYRIRIYFFGSMVGSCPTMMTELSIVPIASLTQRLSSYACPSSQLLPSIAPGTVDAVSGFNYDSTSTGAVYNVGLYQPSGSFNFIQSYTFTLPQVNQIGDTWEVEAVLGLHFPTSALGLLLQPYNGTTTPTPVAPADLSCYDAGNCSIATHNEKGQSTLKTLVLPGTYILWLYDVPRDRNVSLTQCSPFTMSLRIAHAEQMEDFLNCAGEPFPKSISEAGIMDDHGYMYYREDILIDLAVTQNTFQFTITEDSYFRAYTAAHRIDIDLKLINSSKTVAYGYQYGSTEEAIQSFISAGTYTFQLILFGKYNSVFCETALLEIAIAPKSLYAGFDVCTGQTASAPDLSGLTTLSTSDTFVFPYNTYRYVYSGVNSQNVAIVSQSFNVTTDSYLQVQLGSNFLLGDIRVSLTSTTTANGTSSSVQLGYHRRNMHFLDILLPKSQMNMSTTTYTLTVLTADTQGVGSGVGFPPCATYSLSMSVIPANKTGPQLCLSSRPIPSKLNTPQNLQTSPKIHMQEEFLVPKIDALYAKETVTWGNVTTPSYFRFYVEPHHIDIDLKLEENGTTVVQGISFNLEEVIAWVLKPNTNYVLTITYYKWYFVDHGNDPCYTYQAELAITPVTETSTATNCTGTKLPVDIGTVVADSPIYIEDDFQFNQAVDPADIKVKFTLTATSLFRASVTYDFVWNDLALRLDLPGSTDPVQGDLDYNRNEISLIQLVAGNYTLHIYEPFNTTSSKTFNLRNCVEFHLTLGVEVIVNTEVDTLLMSCPDQYFPSVWNAPGLLSNLSGNIIDFNRYVLADVTDKTDSFTFSLYTQSVFRLYLPVDALLDVDVTLYKGTSSVASQVSYGKEESIVMTLAPANYTVKFTYYGLAQTSVLPPPSACAAFKIEVSIWPVAALQAVSNLTSSCTSNFASAVIDPAVTSNRFNFQRTLETQIYFFSFTMFTLKTTSLFTVRFHQSDVAGGIAMLLQAANVSKTYQPLYFQNRIYLNEYLPSGTYNLSFHDPLGKSSLALQCAPYSLSYSLVAATIPGGSCDADVLPSDLNTTAGGSANYGGPQGTDGHIHLYGDNFAMAKGTKNKDNYILISAKTKSYLRIFLALEPGNTITANLFSSPNLTAAAPIASTVAAGSTDRSNVWLLPGQSDYYVLDLYYTTVSSSTDCSYYTFELVLEPETEVLSGLACPAKPLDYNKQMPPEIITTYQGQDYNISSGFYITSDRYSLNIRNNVYTYTMTLNVASNSTISAMVSYDFVVNEFLLMLRDANGNNITTGIHQESPATDSGNNFMNYLQWSLTPGTYKLVLADVGARTFNLTTFCHYFSFAMTISTTAGAGGIPRILQVVPSSGDNLNPNAALTISVTFSEPANIAIPAGYSLSSYLSEQKIVYLQSTGTTTPNVTPIDAFFDMSSTVLQLRFVGFADSQSYALVVNYAKFVTRNNTAFSAGAMGFGHNYVMHKCSGCSGHGSCVLNGDGSWGCSCIANWTGNNCDRCMDGFHGAGVSCVPNTYCNTNSCNTHGSCSDSAGYPVCTCRYGYTGPACDSCAVGFTGYPNCTSNSSDADEDEACTAPLLPTNLNTPAFLGYTGNVHMQGWYYINQAARLHETTFTLTETSVFRVYAEPYEIDIDLWLYNVSSTGVLSMLTFEISFGLEETIFMTLSPGTYMLRFRYYMWVTPSTDCATFNLELAISPLTAVLAETAQSKAYCNGLPNIGPLNVTSPYSYSQTSFSVSAPNSTKISTDSNYFYRLNITIAAPPNKVANLRATVGYRFLPGDISILLEAGTKGDHCGNTGTVFSITPPKGCTYGDNLQNVNTLHTFVEPGNYILWIYEPVKQIAAISSCSPFDFALDIEFVDDEQDVFSCDMPLVPVSLENSQYQERPGYIHFRDYFVLDVDRVMGFNVTQPSLVRAAIIGEDIGMALYDSSTGKPFATNGDDQDISATLPVGSYYLKFTGDMIWFCPILSIEFALAPVANNITVTCPPGSGNPPAITISAIPFDFGPTRAHPSVDDYYTTNQPNTPVVASYPFHLSANGFIDAGVESDFLRGDLHLELYTSSGRFVTIGDFNYNHNLMQEVLAPGDYELRIVLPPGPRVPELPGCIKYNFQLHISYTTNNSPGCETNTLPFTLNTMHFLGYEGTMNFQADNWRIPSLSFATFANINFSVPQASLIHIYVEPHTVDIDIKILAASGGVLASGSNAIGTEESLTYMLNASTTYVIQLQFYNFFGSSFSIPPCASFNMEIEIGPLPVRPAICPNQGSSWPQIPTTLTLPYEYNSIDSNIDLFVQQVSKKAVGYNLTITLPAAANLHAEVGYDFLVGDLVLKLYSVATKDIFLGSNKQDRNILNLINVPKGQYVLTIYEPIYNLDIALACSRFTFALYAQEYSALISEDRFLIEYYFPSSLDTISYLLASAKTHLSGNYFMFDGTGAHESTSLTVKEASVLRVEALMFDSEVASSHHNAPGIALYNGQTLVSSTNGSLLVTVQSGKYTVKFSPPPSFTEQGDMGVPVAVQLALDSTSNLQTMLASAPAPQDCTSSTFDAVVLSPNGEYQDGENNAYVAYSQLSASNDVAKIPFTLDRYSVVYLQVGAQFLLSELEARVTSSNNSLVWHGRMGKNTNVVHQALPAGSYVAGIRSPVLQTTTNSLPHCGIFSYSLVVQDATDPGVIVDCATFQALPWQLDSTAGGSAPFGGPIGSDGALHMYGENMHVPRQTNSFINFTISKASFVSVLAVGYPASFTGITLTIKTASGSTQTPTQTVSSSIDRSRISMFSLQASPYQLAIGYNRGSSVAGICYGYTLQIDIAPASTVQNQVTCPAGITGAPLPSVLTLDPTTNYAAGAIDSFFQGWGSVAGMSQSITFTTKAPQTAIQITLSYNSLVTAFSMKLFNAQKSAIATAQTRGQATKSGKTNVYLYLASTIQPGNYTINITHPSSDSPFAPASQVCAPYVFTYELGTAVKSRVDTSVTPPSVDGLDPMENLGVTVVFSGTVYATGHTEIASVNSSVIASSFYLAGSDNSALNPIAAEALDAKAMRWLITFPTAGVTTAVEYTLSLKPFQLFDNVGSPVTISPNYKYTTMSCGPHGTLKAGKCVCNLGYAGANCDSCDTALGYVQPSGTQICVLNQCTPKSCGCFDDSCSSTIGSCSTNSSGLAHCQCPPAYQGEHCEACKAGYSNWPFCSETCNPQCVHGTCANSKCVCLGHWDGKACDVCPSNFAGADCDKCADDYSGANCDTYKSGGSNWGATKTFLEVTGVLVIIALAAAGAFWYWRYRRAGTRYQLVSRFNMDDDDDETGHHFPHSDNRLVDDEDIPPISHERDEEHEEHEEPRVELPSGGTINSGAPEGPVSGSNNPPRLLDM